ncbi:MAG: tetratricopeptide repeat protein [Legionellaceae bacterium]|nr:tetratricopeptide repeat protein [Legionellaceae bacterium]
MIQTSEACLTKAHEHQKSSRIPEAIAAYESLLQQKISLSPADHNNLATLYERMGNPNKALTHYAAAVHAAPDFAIAHYNLGLILLKQNKLDAAATQFNNVLILNPEHTNAHFYQGIISLTHHQLDAAEKAFQTVLTQHKEHPDALANLGVIALKRDQGQQAITYFSQALAFDEHHEDARNNLAATFMHYDRFENALTHYVLLLEKYPNNLEYHYNAGVAEMALGQLEHATKHFELILKHNPKHHACLTNLASIAQRLGQTIKAVEYLTQARDVNPGDKSSEFMLDAFKNGKEQRPACPEYAQNLFDNYALHYEKHMTETLGYSVPQHMAQALHQLLPSMQVERTLDLGCGTGLSGIILRELSQHLTGVDLSPKMLAHAHDKAVYDELVEAEIITYFTQLTPNTITYELITAADVLPYLGDLSALFEQVKAHLAPQGLFILTHEISDSAHWILQTTARFAHHPRYLVALAEEHGFKIVHHESFVARKHHDDDLPVMLYALQRP